MTAATTPQLQNPFQTPSQQSLDPAVEDVANATLSVGQDASLSLGTDALIVLGSKTTRAISFYNILWAELSDAAITIYYANGISDDAVRPAVLSFPIEKAASEQTKAWIERLLQKAYGSAQRQKRVKVLVNPFGGKGHAQKWYSREIEPIFAAAKCALDVEQTKYQGQAVDLVEKLDTDAWDVIACCSGDGVPHEVFNGLGKKKDAIRALEKVAVVQLPCGSGNAMSLNLNGTNSPSLAALAVVKGIRTPLDLVSITQGDRRTLSFLSQSVGIVAESDLGTDNIRWMGAARFTYGFLVRLLSKTIYPCDIAVGVEIEDKAAIKEAYAREAEDSDTATSTATDPSTSSGLPPLRYGTIHSPLPENWSLVPHDTLGNFYAGNMAYMSSDANFFPCALPSDGCLDLVSIDGHIPRLTALQTLLAVEKGTFFDLAHVGYRKVSGYRIVPRGRRDGCISIDGERVPFEGFQAEVHRGLGTVLSRSGHLFEAPPPPGLAL
ncbi:sphingoid long chain base kinase-like protein [Saccharata proteae CBS 121410]|uniref:Sphingoid long chain base kinase-like protein n=1 Tax=Saccharata proteae CBS 121410 TaxID=1314787 RepID=A0A9P4LU33_9PEZI|nr:sphingoid long chain base kinase-like protein [Saccharata proteae CBS 121410]